jgi:hypothetical protein
MIAHETRSPASLPPDAIALAFIVALVAAVQGFLPSHIRVVARRVKYYLYGDISGFEVRTGPAGVW